MRCGLPVRLARDYQARLLLLHVVEPPVYYGELGMAVPLPADFHESLHDAPVAACARRMRDSRRDDPRGGERLAADSQTWRKSIIAI